MAARARRFGTTAAGAAEEAGEIIVADPGCEAAATAAWLGVREDGTAFLVAIDMRWDSFDLREALEHSLSGDFHIQHVFSGSYQAAPDVRMPGWKIEIEPADAPMPSGAPRV